MSNDPFNDDRGMVDYPQFTQHQLRVAPTVRSFPAIPTDRAVRWNCLKQSHNVNPFFVQFEVILDVQNGLNYLGCLSTK